MRNVQVNLGFTANTSQAQQAIQQLQTSLNNIANTKITVQGGSIDTAVQSARQLSQHLAAATNVNTGKLNFTALTNSLKAANTDLSTLSNNLLAMGPKGQQAFSQVANAVAHAELSTRKANKALESFGVTLMNTIKWQAASTMIHGVMTAFSQAVGHIKKLDKALNDIQIVTGKTSKEMASFAKHAANLSKELSTTSEEYAKASLIFYQQGLNEKEVLARTEATIKMAKVTGEAVQTVSDQLTAIWNNFDNGSKSLEYYVDVITALGAATASSTSEISDGLQKFAAIAETVGLSYEYAATALATITAETRQSADVVGTALKTLFARMEGLKLGETLDDGTTLNQYSTALAKVGINIKDANGNLKDMDIILDEMGAKWQTLHKDQQVALAQQVGGIRQYNQLIALMDNWDTFKINLEIAEDSKGTVNEQFEIYQNSIEASEKALQNAKETLYETLFNADMIKSFNNGLAETLEIITRIVDNAGGLKGLLQFGGLLILKTLLPKLQGFITNITGQISNVIGLTQRNKIKEVGNMAKTERHISGQNPTRSWGGKAERAGAALNQAHILRSQDSLTGREARQTNRLEKQGNRIASRLLTKEMAADSHAQKAQEAKAAREQENAVRAAQGKRAKTEGFKEHWHRTRAEQLDERATAGAPPKATTLGVKSTDLPTQGVDRTASSGEMAAQINKETAGYTAAMLDAKKEYLMIENQLTDTQKTQYKNYEDQLNAERELLRLAREKQLTDKESAETSSKKAEEAIGLSDKGGKSLTKAAKKQAMADMETDTEMSDMVSKKKQYDDQMAAIKREEEELDKQKGGKSGSKEKRAKLAQRRKDLEASELGKANKAYEAEVQGRTEALLTDDNFTRTADLGGAKTKGASKGLSKRLTVPEGEQATAAQTSLGNVAEAAGMGADGSGTAVASVENLEKLGTLQGQYNADAKVAVDLQSELGSAINIASKGTAATAKEQAIVNKTMQKTGDFANKYSKEMKAALKEVSKGGGEAGAMADEILKMADASGEIDFTQVDPKNMQAMQQAVGKVENGLTKAGAAAGQMADTMATDMAQATDQTKDTFTAVSQGAEQLATSAAAAEQQVDRVNEAASKPVPVKPDPYGGLVMGAQGALQAVTGLAMGTKMLSMGLSTAFDPDATGIEKLTGLMMTMQGVQSLLTVGQGLYNLAVGAGNVIAAIAIGIREKGLAGWIKEIAMKGLDTAATIVNAVAKVFNAEASKGLAGVIVGVLAAALIVGTIAMVANTVKTEQSTKAAQANAEKKKEQAESSREAAEAAREEMDAVNELTQAYLDALKVYEDTGTGKEELRKAAFEAIDAMNLEGHELEILAGNYENLTKRIKEYNAAKAGKAVAASNTSMSSAGAAFLAAENVEGTGGLWTTEEDGQKYLTLSLKEKGKTNNSGDALDRWLQANDSPWSKDGDHLRAAYSSSNDIPYLMKEFYRLYDGVSAIASAGELDSMAFFSEAQEMRDSGAWELGQETAATYDSHTDTAITAAKNTALMDVDTQDEYNKAYDEMVNYTLKARGLLDASGKIIEGKEAEAEALIEQLEADLAKDEQFSNYELNRRGLNTIKTTYKDTQAAKFITKEDGQEKSALEQWAEENDMDMDDAIDIFLKINPQFLNSEEQIEEALNHMQAYLDAQKLIIKYDLISGAKSALKEQMSSADWSNFYSQYKELFDPNSESYIGMSFEEFTNRSHSERQALLHESQGNKVEAYDTQIETEEANLANMESQSYKDAYIADAVAKNEGAYEQELADKREELALKYTPEQIAAFTDTGASSHGGTYLDEAVRWKTGVGVEGGMTQKEYDEIDAWARENGWANGAEEYLSQKYEYLNAFNGYGSYAFGNQFNAGNIGITKKSEDDVKAQAELDYESELTSQETKIQGLKDEQHLASLEAADAEITEHDLDAESVYNQANALSEMALASEEVADGLAKDAGAARKAAVEIARFNKAVDSLSDNYDGWMEALESGNLSEVTAATGELKTMYADLLDMDPTDFSNEFVQSTENLALAQKAAAGDASAYNQLQINGLAILGKEYNTLANDVVTSLQTIAAMEGIDVGEKLTYTSPEHGDIAVQLANDYQRAYDAAIAGGASVAEAKAYAADMINQAGYNITAFGEGMEERTVTVTGDLPAGWIPQEGGGIIGPDGQPIEGVEWTAAEGGKYTYTQTYMVPKGMEFSKKAETFGGKTLNKSGGGSEPKKTEKTRKADVVERYKEINDKINDTQKEMDDASKAADRLWGPERVKAMEQVNKALEKNIDLLKDKRAEAQYNLTEDKNALIEAIKTNANVTITDEDFDENGNFTSYNEILNGLYAEKHAAEEAAGPTTDENEQKKIDAIQERIDAVKEAISNYDETNQLIKDLDTEIQDAIYEWQDNNYKVLNAKLEYEIKINDSELEVIDYYLGKIEDDVYAYVEAMNKYQQQSELYTDSLGHQETYFNDLTEAYKNGEISLQAYKEGLQSSQSAIISNLQSLEESKQAMQDYYGNVVSMATEEIGLYTAEMEQLNSVLDHYTSIMELVGKQDDYATKNKILTSKASNIKNELAAQSELYKASAEDAEMWSKKMAEAQVGSNEYETYKKNWQAAQQAANDAQDAMLAKTQEWAEAMKAIIENDLAEAAASMEKSLTGGISFDELMTSMERRSSLQEEYLTTTNKIYETNKLMRQAQQEIDKTSNSVAKKRLQGFITETNQLQNQSELSQYELEIQQAKYDLLLAEIALEEAQNAKSTVRLQRDSEGNFGYVYTADTSAISDAEQNLADKQNSLYNIGLQGANDYQQKYAETLQQSQEAITELTQMWMSGEITDRDEFERRKNEITEYYGEKLEQYSKLHSVALSTDTRVVADAWSSDFTDMIATTEGWRFAVDGYFESAAESMNEWASVCATTLETSKLNDLDGALKGIDDKSKALITTLVGEDGKGGVVGAMLEQIDKASLVSQSQIDIQNAISGTITKYENLLTAVNNAYKAMTTPVKPAIDLSGGNYTPDGTTPTGDGTGGDGGNGSGGGGGKGGNPSYDNGNYDEKSVRAMQDWLNRKSNTDKNIEVDGKWGSQSVAMAKAFNYNNIDEVYAAYQKYIKSQQSITEYGYQDLNDGKYKGYSPTAKEAAEKSPNGDFMVFMSTHGRDSGWESGSLTPIGKARELTDKFSKKDTPKSSGGGGPGGPGLPHGGGGGGGGSGAAVVAYLYDPLGGFLHNKGLGFDTGGYTGSWGSYGKLAMLHEKELILNQGDTANFLTSMEVLERILQILDLQAVSSQLGGVLSSPGFKDTGTQAIEQNIHIDAQFPNATDRFEIEEAFKSMADLASQYANRK